MAAPEGRSGTKHRFQLVAARLAAPHRPPQTFQNFRQQQQQELAVLDELILPITVYKAVAPFDGDGPIDPPVRRIRRTPPRARRRPVPPHVYRQQLYLHPEDMQFDHSYTWTRNSGGPEATVSATRCRASVAAGIGGTHVGPPRGAIGLFGRILMSCTYSHLVARFVGAPKSAAGRCGRTQLNRLSCRRSLAYLAISSAEMCGMSLSGPGSDGEHLGVERVGWCCRAADRLVRLGEGVQQRQDRLLTLRVRADPLVRPGT